MHKSGGGLRTCHVHTVYGDVQEPCSLLAKCNRLAVEYYSRLLDSAILGKFAQLRDYAQHVGTGCSRL